LLGSTMVRALRRDDRGVSALRSFVGVMIVVIAILDMYCG